MAKVASILAVGLFFGVFAMQAEAAKKKVSSAAPTAEQRKILYANGLKNCRKRYGSQLHQVVVEKFYGRWAAVCYHY